MQYTALQDNEKSPMLWKEFKICQLNINDLFFCPLAKNSPCLTLWWHWLSFKNLKILCNNLENFKTVCSHIYTKHFKDLNASHLSIAKWELLSYSIIMTFDTLKVSKFQNEFVKASFLPKYYRWKIWRSANPGTLKTGNCFELPSD